MTVGVLGAGYEVIKRGYDEDPEFKKQKIDGYCNYYSKQIVYCDMKTNPEWDGTSEHDRLSAEKKTVRHEIVHAFLSESGLMENSLEYDGGWAENEEMVDWFASQGLKIYEAWRNAEAL